MQRRLRTFCLCLLIGACAPSAPQSIVLVLVPPDALEGEADAELAIEGLSALLAARLRALPEVFVKVDPAGCERDARATHELRIVRELTTRSALTSLLLRVCGESQQRVEQLVQARDARHDWSAEAAWWVGTQLNAPPPRPALDGTVDEQQMQRFLVALARLKRRTADDVDIAATELSALSTEVEDFALAHAYAAAAQMLAFEFGLLSLDEALQRAEQGISAALAVAPDLGMAHAAQGLYFMNQERYGDAVPQLARAAALDPGDATILLWMGNALLYFGQPRDARPWLERAQRLDPDLVSARISLAEAACLSGMKLECSRFMDDPELGPMARYMSGLLLAHQGQMSEARQRVSDLRSGVNQAWVAALLDDICPLLDAEECPVEVAKGLARRPPSLPRWRADQASLMPFDAKPAVDLWRIDLGLSSWMLAAQRDDAQRERLLLELSRMRAGGLQLPLLDLMQDCLERPPEGRQAFGIWRPILQSWGCPEAAAEPASVVH